MTKNDSRKKPPFWLAYIWAFLIALLLFVLALAFPTSKALQTAFGIAAVLLLVIPFFPFAPDWFEEISGLGVTVKTRRAIQAVRRGQLVNKVVVIQETGQKLWVDDSGIPHRLPDDETAEFLSRQSGKVSIDFADLETLQTIAAEPMAPFGSATILTNENRDFFILYSDTLYYQHSLAYIYKLAALKDFDFLGKDIQKGEWSIIESLTSEQFREYRVA
jgi:hypothetical protein